jgi:hypothetical protein
MANAGGGVVSLKSNGAKPKVSTPFENGIAKKPSQASS